MRDDAVMELRCRVHVSWARLTRRNTRGPREPKEAMTTEVCSHTSTTIARFRRAHRYARDKLSLTEKCRV